MKINQSPPEQAGIDLLNEYFSHFHDKTKNIHNSLDKSRNTFTQELHVCKTVINNFKELTQEQVK